jgi:hypothetical protein
MTRGMHDVRQFTKSDWQKAVRDNRQRCRSGSKLDITAECAVINLLVIYRACHNCRFPHLLDRCTASVVHPVSDFMVPVMRKVKILLTLLVSVGLDRTVQGSVAAVQCKPMQVGNLVSTCTAKLTPV